MSHKITICPPRTEYPEGLTPEVLDKLINWFKVYECAILSTEHHQDGVIHYEGMIDCKNDKIRLNNLKRSLLAVLGFKASGQIEMEFSTRKHAVVVKKIYSQPGAFNYVTKENAGDLVKQGWTDTFIQQQARKGEAMRAKAEVKGIVNVADGNFIQIVTDYIVDNELLWCDLEDILVSMHRSHNFYRVRNGRAHIAFLEMKHNNNKTPAESLVHNWYPPQM